MGSNGAPPHALVIPLFQQGHWNPMKTFIRQLVSMNISITVMSSTSRISELQQWKSKGEFDRLQHVELVEAFTDPPNKRFNRTIDTLKQMKIEFWEQPTLKENMVAQKSAGHGPTFLVADMFLYWTQDVADQLGIPRYTFFTSPTTFALLIHHVPDLLANDYDPRNPHKRDEIVNLPGMELFRVPDICVAVFDFSEVYKLHSEYLNKAAGILINSFDSFEVGEVAALRACLEKDVGNAKSALLCKSAGLLDGVKTHQAFCQEVPNIYLIGPVQCLPTKSVGHIKKELITAETDDSGCLRFLDTQQEASVLYICFGSQVSLGQPSIIELARGLELSEVPFLWILHASSLPSSDLNESLPEGFLSRTEGRGLVCTEWAPQEEILEHSSTGGFLSHCGWNSLVETIRAGVAIIPWPIWAEQHMNARFLVEVAKVALQIQPTPDGRLVTEEIAKTVRLLMNSDRGKETKLKMKELRKSIELTVEDGGSSNRALRAFQEEISSLSNRRTTGC